MIAAPAKRGVRGRPSASARANSAPAVVAAVLNAHSASAWSAAIAMSVAVAKTAVVRNVRPVRDRQVRVPRVVQRASAMPAVSVAKAASANARRELVPRGVRHAPRVSVRARRARQAIGPVAIARLASVRMASARPARRVAERAADLVPKAAHAPKAASVRLAASPAGDPVVARVRRAGAVPAGPAAVIVPVVDGRAASPADAAVRGASARCGSLPAAFAARR
jgi:hypothetical protein